jgi:hypothetical protein
MFKFSELEKANIIAIDTETCDPNLKTMGPGGFRKRWKVSRNIYSYRHWF